MAEPIIDQDVMPVAFDEGTSLDELTTDFKRLKQQKARASGGVEGRVLLNLGFVSGEQYISYENKSLHAEAQDKNKLYLVFNLIGPRFGKLLGRLCSIDPPFKARPDKKDPKALAEAEIVDRMLRSLDQKLKQPSKTWELLWWMGVGGTAFEYVPWVPNSSIELVPKYAEDGQTLLFRNTHTGEEVPEPVMIQMVQMGTPPEVFELAEEVGLVGDVGSEILGPLNVFIDQSVKSIEDLAPDQRVYIAKIRTLGWIKENFGQEVEAQKDFSIVSTQFHQTGAATGGIFLKDLIPLVQGSADANDPSMAVVVEAYAPVSRENPKGRYTVFIPGQVILHDDVNPYEEIPLVDFHWKPVTTSFWTQDYITDLIAPQRFINKRLSQLGEQANATVYSTLLLGPGLKASDIPADYPGTVDGGIAENGQPLVGRLAPPELPSWFMNSLDMTVKLFNDVAGGADLLGESKFPGQLRGPMAVPMLQEILDTEWGPLYNHIGERLARVKQMRLNRVKQFYPPQRTLHYTDRDQKDEVLVFHTEKVLNAGVNYNITVERGELIPELRALREARLKERLAGPLSILYLDERTGRLDKSKIAADLKFGDTGREGREAQYRKLGSEIVGMIWKGEQVPQVLPFYDHAAMMDELEAAMATTEFLKASPPIQQLFSQRWEQHRFYLMQEAQAQQQAMQNGMVQNAVAQATQQAAAMAAAEAVESARTQMGAQDQQPTEELVRSAAEQAGREGGRPGPPQGGKPPRF